MAANLKLRKTEPERLRKLGLNEAWLQKQLIEDPSLLGLGDVHLIQKEKIQPSGGRLDLLLYDPDEETRYEVEIMLGAVDESHIIRTIEYWDIERQRYPMLEHRAVIVAEEITSRFFNVIRLLNRAVPMIAIQLSAFKFHDEIVLQFIKVLDTYDFSDPEEDDVSAEPADRAFWEAKSNPASLAVIDAIRSMVPNPQAVRLVYNRFHIAMGTTGYNFVWFHPRKEAERCHFEVKVPPDEGPAIIEQLQRDGVEARGRHGHRHVVFRLRTKDIREHEAALASVIARSEQWSRRSVSP